MRTDLADDVVIPDDLAIALRRAAEVIPAELGSVDVVARRARHLRRRRGAALGGSLAAIAMVAGAVLLATRDPDPEVITTDDPSTTVPSPPPPAAPAEPLFLDWTLAEVLPDGSVVDLPLGDPADAGSGRPVRLPDGRLLTTATRDLMPGVQRTDGALVEGVAFLLTVSAADGTKSAQYDLRIVGEYVDVVGAIGNEAILARTTADGNCCGLLTGVRLNAFDLTTGAERPLLELDDVYGANGDLAGNRVAFLMGGMPLGPTGDCSVKVADLGSGAVTETPTFACSYAEQVDLSPDGRHAAVVYQSITDAAIRLELVFLDLDTGAVVSHHQLHEAVGPGPQVDFMGMAWSDNTTVRVALQDTDDPSDGETVCCPVDPERLRVETFAVG